MSDKFRLTKALRQTQGLAAHRNPLRPMRPHLLLGNLHSSSRHLLALINKTPEPRHDRF